MPPSPFTDMHLPCSFCAHTHSLEQKSKYYYYLKYIYIYIYSCRRTRWTWVVVTRYAIVRQYINFIIVVYCY